MLSVEWYEFSCNFLKIAWAKSNAMHCVELNKFSRKYIVCMKFHSTLFMLSPPVLASWCLGDPNFSKVASFSILNQKNDFRFTSQIAHDHPLEGGHEQNALCQKLGIYFEPTVTKVPGLIPRRNIVPGSPQAGLTPNLWDWFRSSGSSAQLLWAPWNLHIRYDGSLNGNWRDDDDCFYYYKK